MFKNIFSFSGRIRRTEYWLTGPLIWLIMIPITIISTISVVLLFFIWIIPIWIFLAAGVKRSHDLGNSGWLIFIPIYNPFFLAFGGSQPFKNKYGPNPKGINLTNNENPNIVINNIVHETPNNLKSQQTQKINEKQADTNITKNQHENQQPQNKEEIYKQLSLLHDLKEKGVITEEIYNVERQTILKKIEPTIETPQTNTPPKTEPIIEKEEIKNPAIITPPKPNVVNKPIIQNNQSTFSRRHSRTIQNKKGNNQNSNKILVIIIIILTVLILAVIGYYYYQNKFINLVEEKVTNSISSIVTTQNYNVDKNRAKVTTQKYNVGKYKANKERVYFYNKPDENTIRSAYIELNEIVNIIKIENDFGYVEFTNTRGETSVGWLNLKELSFVNNETESVKNKPSIKFGYINTSNVILRNYHNTNSSIITQFNNSGEKIEIIDLFIDNLQAQTLLKNSITLFVNNKKIILNKGKAIKIININNNNANISFEDEDRNILYSNIHISNVDIINTNKWYKVKRNNGETGWVFGKFITEINN